MHCIIVSACFGCGHFKADGTRIAFFNHLLKYFFFNNLEFPVVVKYGVKVSDDIAVLPFLGPTFACAVSGKYKIAEAKTGTFEEKDWTALKRFNMGFKLGCGAEYNNMYLELGYQFGINNLSKDGASVVPGSYSGHSNAFLANFGVNF